jgi:hypothetical protein
MALNVVLLVIISQYSSFKKHDDFALFTSPTVVPHPHPQLILAQNTISYTYPGLFPLSRRL